MLLLKARNASTKEDFATVSAYVRHILTREVDGQSTGRQIDGMEHKTVATINRLRCEVHQLRLQHLATWSLVDTLTKAFFTCMPERRPTIRPDDPANFALTADTYTYFTSPIRRYPDLLAHRILGAWTAQSRPPYEYEPLRAMADD